MNINFGLFPDVQSKEINGQKIYKKNRRQILSAQALNHSKIWSQKINRLLKNI
jgi:folate-dependent tRNA-U54 methylase TrmFO/GidA